MEECEAETIAQTWGLPLKDYRALPEKDYK
jgi:hypothetical protein